MPSTRKRKSTGGSAQKRKVARKSPVSKKPTRSTRKTPAKSQTAKKSYATPKPSKVEKQWWDRKPASKSARPTRAMKVWWDKRPSSLGKSAWWDKRSKGSGEWWDARPVSKINRTRSKSATSTPKVSKKKSTKKKPKKKAGGAWWDFRDEHRSLELLYKSNAAFLGFFALQMAVCPQFLLDTNFDPSPKMDDFHFFLMRGLGVVGLFFAAITLMVDPVKYLPTMTAFSVLFPAVLPWYAQFYMSVKMPGHLLPFGGTVLLAGWHIYEYIKSSH